MASAGEQSVEQPVREAQAVARYVRIAPRKARIVIDLVRGKSVQEARTLLRFVPKRASKIVEKVIRSAAANATHNYNMDEDRLYIHRAYVDGGPVMKRIHPRARGQAFPILKRTSHITVVLRERGEG
ncbi:MAG: 50S ribosomal protein L22 [Bacillota bacterium]|nr:50S ribosomal protein L22 [Bacillota bacterium]MDI3316690.1 50S ribosomal protein L22 [Bacillota bacterium]